MKPRDRTASEKLRELLIPVPAGAPDVCPGCSSWRHPDESWCPNCRIARNELQSVCEVVIPISLYARPSQFRDVINRYKDRPDCVEKKMDVLPSDIRREDCAKWMQLILGRFLLEIRPLLEEKGRRWDHVIVVPSGWRTGDHPLMTILKAIDVEKVLQPLIRVPRELLSHNRPNERAFQVVEPVEGKSVLLIDDVFTTGASIHSVASALHLAGARVEAGIVIARRIQPAFNEYSKSVWSRQSAEEFHWSIAARRGAAIAKKGSKL